MILREEFKKQFYKIENIKDVDINKQYYYNLYNKCKGFTPLMVLMMSCKKKR